MKKRIYIALAAALLAAALIAFLLIRNGGSDTVGICYRENENSANTAYRAALEKALTRQGYELIVTDADEDQAKQLAFIAELADKKCDILIIEPVMSDAAEELKCAVQSTGLPVLLCNRELDMAIWEDCPNVSYVGADLPQAGTLQGQMVLQLPNSGDINGDGIISYITISGPENTNRGQLHSQTVDAALSAAETHKLSAVYGDWTVDSGRKLCKQELAEFGKDIEVILCGNDQIAIGAVQAIADGGRTVGKDVYLLGMDGDPEVLELIAQDSVTGTVARNTDAEIECIVKIVQDFLNNTPTEKEVLIPYLPVTK